MGGLRPRPSEGRTSKFGSESLDGISSVPHPVVEVEDVAADGIWLHEAWANDGRQTYNIFLEHFGLNASKPDLCVLKRLQYDVLGMSRPLSRVKPAHESHLWLNRASGLE